MITGCDGCRRSRRNMPSATGLIDEAILAIKATYVHDGRRTDMRLLSFPLNGTIPGSQQMVAADSPDSGNV